MKRFQDENKTIWSFANEISVKCPKCTKKASVKRTFKEKYFCYDDFLLECKQCYYKLEKPIYQYIAHGNPYCNSCFEQYKFESQLLKEIPEIYKAKCTHCKNQEEWKPKIKEIKIGFNLDKNKAKDPIYQTELWYQIEFENHIFWAYNIEHITYLEKYIVPARKSIIICLSTL